MRGPWLVSYYQQPMTEAKSLSDAELTETGEEYIKNADALEALASQLRDADSIAEDVPVLCDLFHKVRTTGYRRNGRFHALLDYDDDAEEWSCRSVTFLQQGTHYRNTGADASVSFSPHPFLSVKQFSRRVASSLERDAQTARQQAWNHRQMPDDPRK